MSSILLYVSVTLGTLLNSLFAPSQRATSRVFRSCFLGSALRLNERNVILRPRTCTGQTYPCRWVFWLPLLSLLCSPSFMKDSGRLVFLSLWCRERGLEIQCLHSYLQVLPVRSLYRLKCALRPGSQKLGIKPGWSIIRRPWGRLLFWAWIAGKNSYHGGLPTWGPHSV